MCRTCYVTHVEKAWNCGVVSYTEYSGAAMSKGQDKLQASKILKSSVNKCYDLLEYDYFERTYKEDTKSLRKSRIAVTWK